MTDNHDVIIADMGPVGGQAARDLAARGYDVCVLEIEFEDELPSKSNKSTAGTFPSTMASFNIPDEVVMSLTNDVVLESPNDRYHRHQLGVVLEFADFKNWPVDEAEADGVEYRSGTRVSKPTMEGGEIVGVRYNGDEEVYADTVINATGPSAPFIKAFDLCDLRREKQAVGIEYEFEGMDLAPDSYGDLTDAVMLRLDHDIAPGGYSWVFHTGGDITKVDVCYIQNEGHHHNARSSYTIDDYLQYWIESDPCFADAERIAGKQHRGSAHIQLPGRMSTDNFVVIGDTVPTVDPLRGEGIDKCMCSGRVTAMTADRVFTNSERDTSASEFAIHDQLWHGCVAPKVKNRLLMTEMLYRASNECCDELLEDLRRLPDEQLDTANDGNPLATFRILKSEDLFILASTAKD